MQKFFALYKKELQITFSNPIAYAVIIVFMVLSGYFFMNIANYYALFSLRSMNQYYRNMMDLNMVQGIFRPYFNNMAVVLLLIIPLITMRIFAEEKREGTIELLFTYPVSDFTIVISKFLSALTIFLLMLIGSLSSFLILKTITSYEIGPVFSGFLGLFLLGSAFIMMGVFISSLTESQIVAAVISFGVLLIFWVIGWSAQSAGPFMSKVLLNLSIIEHFDNFAKGLLDTTDLFYYINLTILFFFLTLRILETKQWRG